MDLQGLQVFDFEALNWNRLYAIGIYNGKELKILAEPDKDNSYFVKWLLDNLEPDVIAYAHNGGRYDFLFIFEYLEKLGIGVKPYNLKVIHGSIAQFSLKWNNKRLIFRDSFLILPMGLKSLTYDFDVEHKKLTMEYNVGIEDKNFSEYFKNDLMGLYEVLRLSGLTKHLTIASNTMDIFTHIFYKDKMTANELPIENVFREGYRGGRTEIFKSYGTDLKYYDINSLYPSVMINNEYPLPIKDNFNKVFKINRDKLGIYKINADIENLNIPVLPMRKDNKLIFPIGHISGLYYTPEILKAEQMGYDISVEYGYEFKKTEPIFKGYIEHFYDIKKHSEGSKKAIAKLMLNSLYGKFGQRREQENYRFIEDGTISNLNYSAVKYFDSHSNFIHPEIAGMITANARVKLYELFEKAGLNNVYYCDTDSIITDSVLSTSNELGDIKLVDKIKEFIAISPKLYAYVKTDSEVDIKARGFKVKELKYEHFVKAHFEQDYNGFVEERDRVASFKERFKRRAVNKFADLIVVKKSIKTLYNKRILIDKINTIPIKV